MIKWIKRKYKKYSFIKKFVNFNEYTKEAFTIKTEKEFKKLCWKCIDDIAKKNNKDKMSVSLEDVYRVLHAIRKRTPKILRRVTLEQVVQFKDISSKVGDIYSLITSIAFATPLPLMYAGLKKIFGSRLEYAFRMHIVSLIAEEIYKKK